MSHQVRVLQVLGTSAGGVARHVAQIGVALQDRGWKVRAAGPAGVLEQATPPGTVGLEVPISARPGPRDAVALRRLRAAATTADVVHAHGLRAGALAVLAAGRRTPVVVTLHNLPVGGRVVRGVAWVLERVVSRGAAVVLGVSGDLVDRARDLGARDPERALVPAPPRPEAGLRDATRTALGLPADAQVVLTVGRLAPQKGLDLLCDAAAYLKDRPAVTWLVAGDGPLEATVGARVQAEGLSVRLLGRREDVADLMAAADVVASTARWEGQPLGVQEALSLGAAVVATDVGGTAEVTADAALLVGTDGTEIGRAVAHLLDDEPARTALMARARARADELPGLEDTLGQLERVYRRAGARRAPGADGDVG